MRTRFLRRLCLAFCLFLSMSAFAAEEVTVGSLKYQLNGSEAYVSGYVGEPTDVVIPITIESEGQTFRVTQVNASAFKQCSSITSLTSIGGNLKSIDTDAFRQCWRINDVALAREGHARQPDASDRGQTRNR